MSDDSAVPTHSTAPFLPQPIQPDALEAAVGPFATVAEGEAQHARLVAMREHVAAATDTIELAIAQNHADYLGGRSCWPYDTAVAVQARLKTLKRQRVHVQDGLSQCNRRLKRLQQEAAQQAKRQVPEGYTKAELFVRIATQYLPPETVGMIWALVDAQRLLVTNGAAAEEG